MTQQLEEKDLIKTLNPNDVLCGRGSGPNDYRGNIKFRNMVYERRAEYLASTTRKAKGQIAQEIIDQFRTNFHPPGRFLKKVDPKTAKALGVTRGNEVWVEVDAETALEKAKQALRQNRDYANAGNKSNIDNKKDSSVSKSKKKLESMSGKSNENNTFHNSFPRLHNEVLSSQTPIPLQGAEHISNNFFHQSPGIRSFTPHHHPQTSQEQNYQLLPYQRQDFFSAHREPSGRVLRRNTIATGTPSWDNYNNVRPTYYNDFNRAEREQFRPDGMVSSSLHMAQSRFRPMEMNEFSEQPAMGYTHNMGADVNEFIDHRLGLDKGFGIVNKFGDDQSEMYYSDTESKHRGRGRRRPSRGESIPHSVKNEINSRSGKNKINSRTLKNDVGSSSLRESDVSHPDECSSMEFRNSSESSGLGLTFEQYQVLTREEGGSPERVRSGELSVSTMGTIDAPKKYVFQLPQTVLDSCLVGSDSKGCLPHSKKMSGRSVRSYISSGSTVKSSLFSEMSVSFSEASHDLVKRKVKSKSSRETVIDTTAIQNEEGKIKTNLGWNPTTPRPLADMEDEPDELSSLGETSLTILQAAMDASICSTASNYTSGVESISEYDDE